VRSGGHSYEGLSSTPCSLTVDTTQLTNIEIIDDTINYQTETAMVKVGSGVRHAELYDFLARRELAFPGANCMDVGVTGCTLGGCHGHLSAEFGLSSDNVKSFEIILANSTVLTVSESRYPDLFWALRGGGGGDFGVVTSMEVEAKLLRGVVTYEVFFNYRGEDQSLVVELLEKWQEWVLNDLPVNTSAYLKCSSSFTCVARGVKAGRVDTEVQRAVRQLQSMFELDPDAEVQTMQHFNMQRQFSDCGAERKLAHKVKSLYFDAAIPSKVVETGISVLARGAGLPSADWNGFEIQRVGLSGRRNGRSSAADFYHQNTFLLEFSSSWEPTVSAEQAEQHLEWMRELHVALAPTSSGAYRNYEDLDMGATYYTHATWQAHPASFYYPGDAVLELEQVKLAYDADLVFRHPLSAAFEASKMEQFQMTCREREWAPSPEPSVDDPPARTVLVGVHDKSTPAIQDGHLEDAARRLTHVVYSAVQPIEGGWVNISIDEEEGKNLEAFAKTVSDANPSAKKIIGIGGPGANESSVRLLWDELLADPWQLNNFGVSVRILLDDYDLDGVNIDWTPRLVHRANFSGLLRVVRDYIGPDHELIVHADMSKTAVEEGYDARAISEASDLVMLRAYNFEDGLSHESKLQWLTHFNANLFSVNPSLASGAGGVASWIEAGAPRNKLVLGAVTFGYAYDVDGRAPESRGRLDWRVRGKTAALTELSQTPGEAAWSELHDALASEWSTWTTQEVEELGGAAAWSDELRVWVGYDSPQTVRQKAAWIKSMGMAGGMLSPLHLDAFGEGKSSLVEAFRTALDVQMLEVEEDDNSTNIVMITLLCVIPAICLCCCVDAQLRRWGDIRKMHDGLTYVSNTAESWSSKVRTSPEGVLHAGMDDAPLLPLPRRNGSNAVPVAAGAAESDGIDDPVRIDPQTNSILGPNHARTDSAPHRSRRGSVEGNAFAFPRTKNKRGSVSFFARRFSTASSVQPPASPGSAAQMTGPRRTSVQTSRAGSVVGAKRGSMVAVHSAFDGAMQKGQSEEFDHELHGGGTGAISKEAIKKLSDVELSRKLTLLANVTPFPQPQSGLVTSPGPCDDGYDQQRGHVRYSRLLLRDAVEWLENPECDYMNFYKSKQRGVIKLTIVITMYSETPDLLERSVRGIAHGIHQLSTETAFLRSWDEACVVIVSDGLAKLNEDTAKWLEEMGVYSRQLIDDAAKLDLELEGVQPPVALHCFEGLMQFEDWSPTQTMVVIKQENAGKLDSQRWAFIGIAERLMPNMPTALRTAVEEDKDSISLDDLTFNDLRALDRYLVTVDAGTQPMTNSLRELLIPMRYDPTIAGTCGHMIPDKTIGNILVQSQVFEYEHGHVVDKAMESMFGFITVLPGAYSGFRYDAIRRDQWIQGRYRREGPLVEYFKPLVQTVDSPATLNMGLAEDRFLCFALMVMKNRNYSLWYCRRAQAVTDVPDTLQSFLQQRRRWNNGAFFARLFTIFHYAEIYQGAGHSYVKLLGFFLQLVLTLVDSIYVWFASALFYLWITYNVQRLGDTAASALGPSFLIMYLMAVVAHYDRRVYDVQWVHFLIAIILALEISFCLGIFVYDQARDLNLSIVLLVCSAFGAMYLCCLLQGKLIKMLMMLPGYLLMYPTFAILSQLYGFCHVHDVSWGTKGIETVHSNQAQEKEARVRLMLSSFRFRILVFFILSNFLFGYVVGYFNTQYDILLYMLLIIIGCNAIRYLGSISFTVVCWLDDALQLTALHGGIEREFGELYADMKEQVSRINRFDVRTGRDVLNFWLKRAEVLKKKRREERLRQISEEPEPVNLAGNYFDDAVHGGFESDDFSDSDGERSEATLDTAQALTMRPPFVRAPSIGNKTYGVFKGQGRTPVPDILGLGSPRDEPPPPLKESSDELDLGRPFVSSLPVSSPRLAPRSPVATTRHVPPLVLPEELNGGLHKPHAVATLAFTEKDSGTEESPDSRNYWKPQTATPQNSHNQQPRNSVTSQATGTFLTPREF